MKALLTTTLALGFIVMIGSELNAAPWQYPVSPYQQARMMHPGWGYWGWGHPGYFGHRCEVNDDYGQPVVMCY